MIANAAAYRDVTVHHMQTLGPGKYAQPEYKDHFHFDGWFLSPSTRKCVADRVRRCDGESLLSGYGILKK